VLHRVWLGAWIAAALVLAAPVSASAQAPESVPAPEVFTGPERWELGFGLLLAKPLGEFSEHVDSGDGFRLFGVLYFGDRRRIGLRLEGVVASYGRRTVTRQLDPSLPLAEVDVTTDSSIGSLSVGPQVTLGQGRARFYAYTSVGSSQFLTSTSMWGGDSYLPIATRDDFESHSLLLAGGAGFRFAFRTTKRHPVAVDLGGDLRRHGRTEYLSEASIVELAGGGTQIEPVRSDTNMATVQLGVTVGMR